MAAKNPGSVAEFARTHTDIPDEEVISAYSAELAAYRSEVADPVKPIVITPEMLVLQQSLTKRALGETQN